MIYSIRKFLVSSFLMTTLLACVTINVYFPAAAAEQAADTIIRDIVGQAVQQPSKEPAKDKQSSTTQSNYFTELTTKVLYWLIPEAHAAANLDINSPAIRTIRARMKARYGKLSAYIKNGAIGMNSDTSLVIRNAAKISGRDRNAVKKRISAENKDRKSLYIAIAKANGHPEWANNIQATFSRRWIANYPAGTWYKSGGSWKQK